MSGPSSNAMPAGVVRNSALSFVASAQATDGSDVAVPVNPAALAVEGEQMTQTERLMPPGLTPLYEACTKVYPDQPNPLQVTTRLKYWLGGQDPLDYISMYWNPGRPDENIPPHWHYVSFGLSDLHGDGRVHPEPHGCSGYGLELTFRLASEDKQPPLWPAALLQALARYIFTTGNKFVCGDHVSWHAPLDGSSSRVRHLLVATDPQLETTNTCHGSVTFLQMVGCTSRELRAAQRGSGFEVLNMISEDPRCGGAWLVTRTQRRVSARIQHQNVQKPAHLAGVSARVAWREYSVSVCVYDCTKQVPRISHKMSTDSFKMSSIERALPQLPEMMQWEGSSTRLTSSPTRHEMALPLNVEKGSWRGDEVEYLNGVHLLLNAEAASLLPLAIDGRVLHDRHFTWRQGPRTVTLLTPAVGGAFVTRAKPYASKGPWLQILIPPELAGDMSKQVSGLARLSDSDSESDEDSTETSPRPSIPITLTWPHYRLSISVLHDLEIL
ncbi:putative suppressor of fused [Danaus plexippus plexippus]|uniref:Suppressor of fused homolog n=1 Tax=Danaus plexippus plexippus TaxID=278856 RepID=A0A212EJU1_DANPL|nr:putative suppressor of fused [Danaus plexippus plexippus]